MWNSAMLAVDILNTRNVGSRSNDVATMELPVALVAVNASPAGLLTVTETNDGLSMTDTTGREGVPPVETLVPGCT